MNSFGKVKRKILKKLVESYSTNNKGEIKKILNLIKKDKDFKEMYLFYEEIEKMSLTYPGSAELYLETVEPLLIERAIMVEDTLNEISKLVENVVIEDDELYDILDVISEKTNLKNLDKKVVAKRKLVEFLKKEKEITEKQDVVHTMNENLLFNVLTNNFNVLFENTLNEEQKNELKNILSLSDGELETKINQLKEDINNKITNLLSESTDNDLKEKLKNVKEEVNSKSVSRINYYNLTELKNGLN